MHEPTLARARAGDGDAFHELTAPYRQELQLHLYRLVGSAQDAEDMLQETLLAAWRSLDAFEGRASFRAWLYRIATNRALDALRAERRRPPTARRSTGAAASRWSEPSWLEPYPDALTVGAPDDAPGPDVRYETREAIALAFVAGLQHLPPQQRAVLVLRDVLGFRAAEAADLIGATEHAVNSLLRRARAAFENHLPVAGRDRARLPGSQAEEEIASRLADAFEAGDVGAVVALLSEDAWLTMPPEPHAFRGHDAIAAFLRDRAVLRGSPLRLVATRANGQPAFGCYLPSPDTATAAAYGLLVVTLSEERISALTWFAGSAGFPRFGLPPTISGCG